MAIYILYYGWRPRVKAPSVVYKGSIDSNCLPTLVTWVWYMVHTPHITIAYLPHSLYDMKYNLTWIVHFN